MNCTLLNPKEKAREARKWIQQLNQLAIDGPVLQHACLCRWQAQVHLAADACEGSEQHEMQCILGLRDENDGCAKPLRALTTTKNCVEPSHCVAFLHHEALQSTEILCHTDLICTFDPIAEAASPRSLLQELAAGKSTQLSDTAPALFAFTGWPLAAERRSFRLQSLVSLAGRSP